MSELIHRDPKDLYSWVGEKRGYDEQQMEIAWANNNGPTSEERTEWESLVQAAGMEKMAAVAKARKEADEHNKKLNQTQHNSINDLLKGKRPEFKQMKGGVHNDEYYFGTTIYENNIPLPAVITSERNVWIDHSVKKKPRKENQQGNFVNEISNNFGLKYSEQFQLQALDTHISYAGIRKFLGGANISIKDCYQRILAINSKYMYYADETTHKLIALDILSTYFLPLFRAKGRKYLQAAKSSGKTRQSDIMALLCCNAVKTPDVSKAGFFRLMEGTVWTLLIDDFDRIHVDQKNDILQHYLTGYKTGSKSIRTGEAVNGMRSIETFHNYGHVVLNNISGLDSVAADRSVRIPIVKTSRAMPDLPRVGSWQELVDDCYVCALNNWQVVLEKQDSLPTAFRGRQGEITHDLLTLASLIDEATHKELWAYLKDMFQQKTYYDHTQDHMYWAFQCFIEPFSRKIKDEGFVLSLKEITSAVCEKLNRSDLLAMSQVLGKEFDMLSSFFSKRKPQNKVHIVLDNKEAFSEYLKTRDWYDEANSGNEVVTPDVVPVEPLDSDVFVEFLRDQNAVIDPTTKNSVGPWKHGDAVWVSDRLGVSFAKKGIVINKGRREVAQ